MSWLLHSQGAFFLIYNEYVRTDFLNLGEHTREEAAHELPDHLLGGWKWGAKENLQCGSGRRAAQVLP